MRVKDSAELDSTRLEGDADFVVSYIQGAVLKYKEKGWTELQFGIGWGGECSEGYVELYGLREETEEELMRRTKREQLLDRRKEAEIRNKEGQERREYERLKQKFEGEKCV